MSLLLNGGEDYFVRRQRRILLAVWAIEFFLGITLIIPLIAKYFFYKGYKELSEVVVTRNHEILQNNGRKSKGGSLIMAIILIILAFLFFIILLAGVGAGYYLR
ncbi:hypothetical protein [Candidatus Mycoplasma haematobovis]|uniref:hypothetical protein n=1 Tax=Candidatus Mycoplasma haematobovis TaxID=432608 RepID=UPI00164F272E|nr:hypothetical protein [Candidatus Mycoplasma haematobovis]